MSIFFYHFVLAFLPLFIIAAHFGKKDFAFAFFGALLGGACFSALNHSLIAQEGKIFFDILALIALFLLPFCAKFCLSKIAKFCIFALGVCACFEYFLISANFKIFSTELLDSGAILNLFMVILALSCLALFYLLYSEILKNRARANFVALTLTCAVLFIAKLGFVGLGIRQGGYFANYASLKFINSSEFLSIIAKIIYHNNQHLILILCVIALFMGLFYLNLAPKKLARDENIIAWRINKSARFKIWRNFLCTLALCALFCAISLYYLLVASRPPTIDTPTLVEPVNGEFVFDAQTLQDGRLHRYAYISDDGHKIRFFLLNKFSTHLSPVAVFDACSICGDMGYVKKGDELICIACNVRIFLPSVGKMGGCNPIPMKFDFDGERVKIALSEILSGASYFSEIVEKQVIDPVSRARISNSSKFSYLYYGRIYFFENEKNEEIFTQNPQNFVDENGTLKELK